MVPRLNEETAAAPRPTTSMSPRGPNQEMLSLATVWDSHPVTGRLPSGASRMSWSFAKTRQSA